MKLAVVAVGRLKSGPEQDLAGRYLDRASAMARGLGFSGPEVAELAESRARRAEDRRVEEATAIRARLGGLPAILLDETAPSLDSPAFAAEIGRRRDSGAAGLAFVIGGPDGFAPDLLRSAALTLSFGRLTLPHQLVRVLVCEQIYRAMTILAGHPYHRAGGEGR